MSEEEIQIEIDKKNNQVIIRLPFFEKPSKSGAMILVANSRGWQKTDVIHKGKNLWVNVGAGTKVRG